MADSPTMGLYIQPMEPRLNALERTHPFRLLFTAYKWIVVAPLLAISTLVLGAIILILSALGAENFASRVFATFWARFNSAVSVMNVQVSGKEHLSAKQSYVIVANHQSLYDIYVLYGYLGIDIKWVMKSELRAVPILGIACEAMGHILIDRSNTEASLRSINSARSRIHDGVSVIFFPEGTRSRNGELKTFKKGAFRFAQEMGLPILPVAIHGTKDILPSDTIDLLPGNARLEILEPIDTQGLQPEDVNDLSRRTKEIIGRALSQ